MGRKPRSEGGVSGGEIVSLGEAVNEVSAVDRKHAVTLRNLPQAVTQGVPGGAFVSGVEIMTPSMIERMRESCRMAADCLVMVGEHIRPGITTEEINTLVHRYITERNAYPAPLNYKGFPKSVCTSPNEVVCHGIPGRYALK